MPSGSQWGYFILITAAFGVCLASIMWASSVQQIKKDWPLLRCSPMYMMFADNVSENFTYCVQNMQKSMMGDLLQPLTYVLGNVAAVGGSLSTDLNAARTMLGSMRTMISSVFQNIFGVFLNIIISFQGLTIKIKDIMGKLVGVLTTVLYLVDGVDKTTKSAWQGPPGQLMRKLGSCFCPSTAIELADGSTTPMHTLEPGDQLAGTDARGNPRYVVAVMRIFRDPDEVLYELGEDADGEPVRVTGSHVVLNQFNHWVCVERHQHSVPADDQFCPYFSCLVTSDHRIPIGSHVFWDWDDFLVTSA